MGAATAGADPLGPAHLRQPRHEIGQQPSKRIALRRGQPADGAAQVPQRVMSKHRLPRFCHVKEHAASVIRAALPRQKTARLQRLEGLRGSAARRRLETGKGRGRARGAVGAREKPQRGPLRRRHLRPARLLRVARARHMQQKFGQGRRVGSGLVLHGFIIAKRNWFDQSARRR
jgi:hypothetical protein